MSRRHSNPYPGSQRTILPLRRLSPTNFSSLFEQSLFKSSSPKPPTSASSSKQGMSSGDRRANGGPVQIRRRHNEASIAGLPPRPRTSVTNQSIYSEPIRRHEGDQVSRGLRQGQQHRQDQGNVNRPQTRTPPVSSARATPMPDGEPQMRRKKLGPEPSVPSLLSRLALSGDSTPPAPQSSPASVPAKRSAEPNREAPAPKRQHTLTRSPTVANIVPSGGLSIKGAASRKSPEPASLLNRLRDEGGRGDGKKRRTKP